MFVSGSDPFGGHSLRFKTTCRPETLASKRGMAKRSLTSPATLYIGAWSNRNAMRFLLPSLEIEGNHNLNAPYAMLCGFAIELAFKAVLRARGYDDGALQKLSHNLVAGHSAATATGFISSDPKALAKLVSEMNDPHANFLVRYIPANIEAIGLPRPAVALTSLSLLLNDVEEQVPEILAQMPG